MSDERILEYEKMDMEERRDKYKLFSEKEILDIEEQQDINVFDNLLDAIEDNYLELEATNRNQT